MELRNGFLAHRDDTEYEQAVVVMQVPKGEITEDNVGFRVKSAKTVLPSLEKLENYLDLFEFLLPKIEEKIKQQAVKTIDAFFKNLDVKYINMLRID